MSLINITVILVWSQVSDHHDISILGPLASVAGMLRVFENLFHHFQFLFKKTKKSYIGFGINKLLGLIAQPYCE